MVTYKIVVGIFDGSEREYPNKRNSCGDWRQRGYSGDHLKYQQTQEVKIGEPLKLLKQIQWQERQNRILGRLNVIILKKQKFHHTLNICFQTLVYLKCCVKTFKNIISKTVILCNRIAQKTLKREKYVLKHQCDWLFVQF